MFRPRGNLDSDDPDFGPYISTLPRSFESHPLHWYHRKESGDVLPAELKLLSFIPPSVLADLESIYKRYESDWDVAKRCLVSNPSKPTFFLLIYRYMKERYKDSFSCDRRVVDEEDFLWGWLTGQHVYILASSSIRSSIYSEHALSIL